MVQLLTKGLFLRGMLCFAHFKSNGQRFRMKIVQYLLIMFLCQYKVSSQMIAECRYQTFDHQTRHGETTT
jgi:hypothetical protein